MKAPKHIEARMRRIDRNLLLRWNNLSGRWELLRRDPVQPQRPPDLIKVWATPDGEFLPADNRIIFWLVDHDCSRLFEDRDRKYWGRLLMQEVERGEAAVQAAKDKALQEEFEALKPGLEWVTKRHWEHHPVSAREIDAMTP